MTLGVGGSHGARAHIVGLLVLTVAFTHFNCGGSEDGGSVTPLDPSQPSAPAASSSSSSGGGSSGDAGGSACGSPALVTAISQCIDSGSSPRDCLAKANAPACDVDQDGLDDTLEDAMLRSYAPVFAYNEGDGDHTTGDSESAYPTTAEHYTASSTLYWRVDGDDATKMVVDKAPALDKLRSATFDDKGTTKHADSPALGQGTNFWLCLNKDKSGNYDDAALVKTADASRSTGVDLFSVAHPSGADPKGDYVVLEYMLFYAYNRFTLDDHEGDFEGGAVFVSLSTGKVSAFYTDRHATSDGVTLIPLEGKGALPAKAPSKESPHYNVCDATDTPSIGGVRFYDFDANKHHPVIYVAGGGHASYGYPGATKIQGALCVEMTMIRDVHNGNGPKLVPHEDAYVSDFKGTGRKAIDKGVHIRNLGEPGHLREAWSAFAGQWGCTLEQIPKSYPGPWDNERLCRHWLTNDWGDAPPFKKSTVTSCKL